MLTNLRKRLMTRMLVLAVLAGSLVALAPGTGQAARREQRCGWMTCYDLVCDENGENCHRGDAYSCYICF